MARLCKAILNILMAAATYRPEMFSSNYFNSTQTLFLMENK